MQQLMEGHPRVREWMARVARVTAPHYDAASALLRRAAKRFKEDRDAKLAHGASKL